MANALSFRLHQREKLETPQRGGLHMIYKDHWWAIKDGCLMFYRDGYGSPQCNINRAIVEKIRPEADAIVQIPFVYVPTNARDWA